MTPLSRPEYLLAAGFVSATLATALVQFVMIGLIGLLFAPVALVLLVVAGVRGRSVAVSRARASGGLFLFLGGLMGLGYAAGQASSFGYSVVFHRNHSSELLPSTLGWALLLLCCAASAVAIAKGLALRASLSPTRSAFWGGAAFLVPPLGLGLFLLAAPFWPIGT